MIWLLLLSQLTLSAILVIATTGKILNLDEFTAALRLSYMPEWVIKPVGLLIPATEVALAFCLVFATPRSLQTAMALTVGLFALFSIWMLWILASRPKHSRLRCGCFGAGTEVIDGRSLLRNVLLLSWAVCGAFFASSVQSPLPLPSTNMFIVTSSAFTALALLVGLWTAWPNLLSTLEQLEAIQSGQTSTSR